MPIFKPIEENEVSGKVKEIFEEIKTVRQMCDRIAVLKNGKLCEVSMTEELFKNPSHDYTKELLTLMPKIESIYN